MVLRQVLVSGPITALVAAWKVPQRKVTIFGKRTSGPCGGCKEGLQGRKGSITPLRCMNDHDHNQPLSLFKKHNNNSLQEGSMCIVCTHILYI